MYFLQGLDGKICFFSKKFPPGSHQEFFPLSKLEKKIQASLQEVVLNLNFRSAIPIGAHCSDDLAADFGGQESYINLYIIDRVFVCVSVCLYVKFSNSHLIDQQIQSWQPTNPNEVFDKFDKQPYINKYNPSMCRPQAGLHASKNKSSFPVCIRKNICPLLRIKIAIVSSYSKKH